MIDGKGKEEAQIYIGEDDKQYEGHNTSDESQTIN